MQATDFRGKTEQKRGLSEEQVERSRRQYGANVLTRRPRNGFFKQFLASFGDPIIKILLAALAINVLFLFQHADWYESAGIAIAVFLATFVSTLSEYGSEAAFEKLQAEAEQATCRLRRGADVWEKPVSEVVVGDIVLLQAGERVPADGILLAGEVRVDQSALNGESREVRKRPGRPLRDWDLGCTAQLFQGSVIAAGEGVMQVGRVGDATFYGSMAQQMQESTRQSPLKLRLSRLAGTISKIGYGAAGLVAFADLFNALVMDNGYKWALIAAELQNVPALVGHVFHAVTLAITVIVVAVPEGLPMMITVVLSSNMKRMLKDHVLVRKLVGIETSGSLNILFTDKTGTLTSGRLQVRRLVSGDGKAYEMAALQQKKKLYALYALSAVYNTQSLAAQGRAIGGNATERALLDSVLPLTDEQDGYAVRHMLAFDSARKFSAVHIHRQQPVYLVKGAPEKLLPACKAYVDANGESRPLTEQAVLRRQWKAMTDQRERVLALAMAEQAVYDERGIHDLTLIGLVGIRDELRPQSRAAVAEVQKAGIQVVMITGDNRETAVAIAREAGLVRARDRDFVLTSDEINRMDDAALKRALPRLRVVARALPTDKSRLVRLAQECGWVVGMTGDGINDAPALKKADVGFAMGSGTEVAKEAGDIVILDDNFASIGKAVLYGRTIFHSIRKFIVFQLTMNLCAVGVSILGPFIGIDTPVTVIQMLWVNIIMDALAGLAFAGEAPLAAYMKEAPKALDEPILNRAMAGQIAWMGLFTIGLCLYFLKSSAMHRAFHYQADDPTYFMTAFFALFIFCGICNSFNARTPRTNLFSHLAGNPSFVGVMVLVTLVQLVIIYYGGSLFRTVGLGWGNLASIAALAMWVIPADILRKIGCKWWRMR